MTPNFTREDIRTDILEITTTVISTAIKANNHVLLHMINEDLAATNQRIDNLSRRMNKRFKQVDQRFEQVDQRFERLDNRFERLEGRVGIIEEKIDTLTDRIEFTHKLLHVHIANPSAHHPR